MGTFAGLYVTAAYDGEPSTTGVPGNLPVHCPARQANHSVVVGRAGADELTVSAISWFEVARLAQHERVFVTVPIRSWLEDVGR